MEFVGIEVAGKFKNGDQLKEPRVLQTPTNKPINYKITNLEIGQKIFQFNRTEKSDFLKIKRNLHNPINLSN